MKRVCALSVAACLLSGQTAVADNKYYRVDFPLPPSIQAEIPKGIPAKDLLVQDGCFFYMKNGKVYQVLSRATKLPVCIG